MANTVNILSLFSGSGQHDEAVCIALEMLGYVPRVVGYAEREAAASAMLLAGMEKSRIPQAPVWCDEIEKLDARPLRGWVDVLVASPPCQPYSCAGKKEGLDDRRSYGDEDGPLPHVVRIIDECRPQVVWFENVGRWVTGGYFRRFGEDLQQLGYTLEEPIFLAASDVGAPHQRERVFILGHRTVESRGRHGGGFSPPQAGIGCSRELDGDCVERSESTGLALGNNNNKAGRGRAESHKTVRGDGPQDANIQLRGDGQAISASRGQRECGESSGPDGLAASGSETIPSTLAYNNNAPAQRLAEHDRTTSPEPPRLRGRDNNGDWNLPLFPPPRGLDLAKVAKVLAKAKSPEEEERVAVAAANLALRIWGDWCAVAEMAPALMPAIESGVSVVADGLAPAAELLRIGGNGVVPLQVIAAFISLWTSTFDAVGVASLEHERAA